MFVSKYQKDGDYSNFKIKYMKGVQTDISESQIGDAAIQKKQRMLERRFTVKEEKQFREHQKLMVNNNPFDSLDEGSDCSNSHPTARAYDSKRGQPDVILEGCDPSV